MKKILVIGCSGFIGSALSKYFADKGNEVYGSDLVFSHQKHLKHFFLAEESLDFFKKVFSKQFDLCINCSGSASVPFSFQHPYKDFELNTRMVFILLSAIKEANSQCRFMNLSSAAVYGNPGKLPIKESDEIRPVSPYGVHKHMSEMVCAEFSQHFNLATCSLRIFSAYGPELKKQLFWDLYQKAQSASEIKLFGSGHETRDFIFVDDLVSAIVLVSQSKVLPPAVNVANGIEIRISDVVREFVTHYDSKLKYSFSGENKKGDPLHWKADIALLKSLGYKTTVNISEGIGRYVSWLQSK